MKTRLILLILVSVAFFSCKNGETKEGTTPETETVVEKKNTITLSNYSDLNWKNGIGITFKMFITDNTPEKLELLKTAKQLELADGKIIAIAGFEVAGGFIQILLNDTATQYAAAAEYPNVITVK